MEMKDVVGSDWRVGISNVHQVKNSTGVVR